jgi:hypothetical protein
MTAPPPLVVAAALLFWGWQCELLPIAIVFACLFEFQRLVNWRVQVAERDFRRVADVCTSLFGGIFAFILATRFATGKVPFAQALLAAFQLLPAALLPLVLVQSYSTAGSVELTSLSHLARRAGKTGIRVSLSFPFFALTLLAASASNRREIWFYPAIVSLCAVALWRLRDQRAPTLGWGSRFAAAALLGYAGQAGLAQLQTTLEDRVTEWLASGGSETDPYRSTTDLGHIGELKQSDRIVLRIDRLPEGAPLLLHRASYDLYASPSWLAKDAAFSALSELSTEEAGWQLAQHARERVRLNLYVTAGSGSSILALPAGSVAIRGPQLRQLSANRLGSVRAEHDAGLVAYQVSYDRPALGAALPQPRDRELPPLDAAVLNQVARQLRLAEIPPERAIQVVRDYFARDFQYSTYRRRGKANVTALGDFLLFSRSGHCEYFATATTLLLRSAGIPARYATGFAVTEWSDMEQRFVVRERHAHAWSSVWLNGRWLDVDTTPAGWVNAEAQTAAPWSVVADLWSWIQYAVRAWRLRGAPVHIPQPLLYAALLLCVAALVMVLRRSLKSRDISTPPAVALWPGHDSEFPQLERRLAEQGLRRLPTETRAAWWDRLATSNTLGAGLAQRYAELERLHCRYRFDPQGINAAERSNLRGGALALLDETSARSPASTHP